MPTGLPASPLQGDYAASRMPNPLVYSTQTNKVTTGTVQGQAEQLVRERKKVEYVGINQSFLGKPKYFASSCEGMEISLYEISEIGG